MASQAVDPYAAVLDNYFAAENEAAKGQTPDLKLTAAEWKVVDLESALRLETQKMAEGPEVAPPLPISRNHNALMLAFAFLLIAVLAFRKTIAVLNSRFNPWAPSAAIVATSFSKLRAEEEAFSEFLLAFKNGPTALPGGSATECEPVQIFLGKAPQLVGELRKLLQKIGATTGETTRRAVLMDLHRELRTLKGTSGLPELLPVWQMAAAVEGLVKQLISKSGNVTASTLRTVAGALDLLDDLCKPGVRPDLLSNPPLRLLAVDDDLISRHAVSLALKKALNQPDLAENGEAALVLATQHIYDVMFLDVQMPGMDGFELCSKIHETAANQTTPVVFVTSHSDFDARARSVLSGGTDLIAKPFLTFEITVKALTLVLQGRLQRQTQTARARNGNNGFKALSPATAKSNAVATVVAQPPAPVVAATVPTANGSPSSGEPPSDEVAAFLARAVTQLGPLRDLIQAIFQTNDENSRAEMLSDFYLRFHSITAAADSVGGHPALRMSSALDGLLKKLFENPKHCTSSALLTVSSAVDLLNDLCLMPVEADLASNPPIRMLVVDDDPVARRAISCALQIAFEKPENVENGEAALAAATERAFDVIFMDVQMPGMDGFTACSRILETGLNRETPVVFITGQSDFKARTQATMSGGGDLIAKPFLTAEVTVKALTFALRGRLQKRRTGTDAVLQSELRRGDAIPSEPQPERPRWKKNSSDRREKRTGRGRPAREEMASRRGRAW